MFCLKNVLSGETLSKLIAVLLNLMHGGVLFVWNRSSLIITKLACTKISKLDISQQPIC